jgi:hypothetical protein
LDNLGTQLLKVESALHQGGDIRLNLSELPQKQFEDPPAKELSPFAPEIERAFKFQNDVLNSELAHKRNCYIVEYETKKHILSQFIDKVSNFEFGQFERELTLSRQLADVQVRTAMIEKSNEQANMTIELFNNF